MIDTNKKYLAIVSMSIMLGIGLIPSLGTAQPNLSINETDIQFYDLNGNPINSATIGDTIIVKITFHNTGNEDSEPTDVEVLVQENTTSCLLYVFSNVVVPANGVKELTITWDTSKNIGTSIYPVEKGMGYLLITYYPTDENIKETDANSGFVFSPQIEFKEPTENNNSSEIISILLIIGGVFLLIFIMLVIVAHKRNAGKNIRKKKGDDWI